MGLGLQGDLAVTYAATTDVSVERSRAEIERNLEKYGARAFGYSTREGLAMVVFETHDRRVAFELPLPSPNEKRFTHHARGTRTLPAARAAWEQACRQRWRSLNLVIKAKLEAIDAGVSEFEDEFAAFIVLPDGTRVGDWLRPQIAAAYENNEMPPMMQLGTGR